MSAHLICLEFLMDIPCVFVHIGSGTEFHRAISTRIRLDFAVRTIVYFQIGLGGCPIRAMRTVEFLYLGMNGTMIVDSAHCLERLAARL